MKTELREISPSTAKEMLKRNSNNRALNERHCMYLSRQMSDNKWLFDGQPIRFSEGGILLDGQHRLSAIVDSGTTQKLLVITGIKSEAFKVMDTGKVRSGADCFKISGVEYYADVAACAKMIINQARKRRSNSGDNKVTNTDLLEWYNDNKIITDHIKRADVLKKQFSNILSRSYIASLLFLFAQTSVTDSEVFISKLCSGLDVGIKSPIYVLRKKLIEDKMNTAKLPAKDKLALIIKAWNFYRVGKEIQVLKWNSTLEKFPTIL